MKKIMFNDKYGLTQAVLEGRKTQTRRIVDVSKLSKMQIDSLDDENSDLGILTMGNLLDDSRYKVGEEVAVAQSYKEVCYSPSVQETIENELGMSVEDSAGHNNKMFVRADLMPHHIRITDIRIERLQDISDADCIKEGVSLWVEQDEYSNNARVRQSVNELIAFGITPYQIPRCWDVYESPREAYAALIDKVSGKGTWNSNPWAFVYDFELVK